MNHLDKIEMKSAVKEAIKEWLDSKFLEFGKWTFRSLMAAALGAMAYLILWANGWGRHT